jgi:hypothetical protein
VACAPPVHACVSTCCVCQLIFRGLNVTIMCHTRTASSAPTAVAAAALNATHPSIKKRGAAIHVSCQAAAEATVTVRAARCGQQRWRQVGPTHTIQAACVSPHQAPLPLDAIWNMLIKSGVVTHQMTCQQRGWSSRAAINKEVGDMASHWAVGQQGTLRLHRQH